ncbi:MAG: hypothetical protein GX616_21125 [Planctomycetes bacterium]|nr:hypothetical protein [Planctomycetota bacterium]
MCRIVMATVGVLGLCGPLAVFLAQGQSSEAVPRGVAPKSIVTMDGSGHLADPPRLLVHLQGPEPFQTRLLQDALCTAWGRSMFDIVSQPQADRLLSTAPPATQPSGAGTAGLRPGLTQAAREANVEAMLVGTTMLLERPAKSGSSTTRVLAISLQLVRVKDERVTGAVYAEYDADVSYADIAMWLCEHLSSSWGNPST